MKSWYEIRLTDSGYTATIYESRKSKKILARNTNSKYKYARSWATARIKQLDESMH